MVTPTVGDVVIVPFPFTDLSSSRIRPAIVLADVERGDWILCQVTSNAYADTNAVVVNGNDFAYGNLRIISYARPGKLFTAHQQLFKGITGQLKPEKLEELKSAVITLFA